MNVSGKNKLESILFVGYFLSELSFGRCVCEDLSTQFSKRGYHVVTVSASPNRYKRVLDIIYTIIGRRKEFQVTYVEVYNGLAFFWAEVACFFLRLLKKPYVITLHGARLIQFSERWPARFKMLLANATRVTTPSKLFQKEFSKWRPDIGYLPNAIDVANYPYKIRSSPQARLGWLRKFEHNYNPQLAVRLIDILRRDWPNARLTMSGADPHDGSSEEVKALLNSRRLSDYVLITGFIDRASIPEWFSNSDIFINTTKVESFGIAVMEAAAAGMCIVTTAVGELPNIWENEVDALLVPSDDPEAMAAAIRRVLTEPGLAERLSTNARKKAERYDWSVVMPLWEELFQQLLKNA